jgi:hypothetical protein
MDVLLHPLSPRGDARYIAAGPGAGKRRPETMWARAPKLSAYESEHLATELALRFGGLAGEAADSVCASGVVRTAG